MTPSDSPRCGFKHGDPLPEETEQGDSPTCPYCGSHEVRATRGVLSVTGSIAQALCACGKWYRLDDGRL